MDTTDPEIVFDEEGICNYCRKFKTYLGREWFPNEEGKKRLAAIVDRIKEGGKRKKYDSIMGLSGGVDSSYMAYQVNKLGLRPLVVHVDGGWNSEVAVRNIEIIVKKLGFDLSTYVVDFEEMRDLQVSFLRSAVANQDVPQDHAFLACLYRFASEKKIKYVLSGGNLATESILPKAWGYNPMDSRHLKAIHKQYGQKKLKTFPTLSFFRNYLYYPYIKKLCTIRPLDYMPYIKLKAKQVLQDEVGWIDYGAKHHESRFTKFFQAYYLPKKFGYDKRIAHLSCLIVSGQLTRDEALNLMKEQLYPEHELRKDKEFIIKKLGLTKEEFEEIESLPVKSFRDYPSNYWFFHLIGKAVCALRKARVLKNPNG